MIYELRIYRCVPGRKPALLSRFEKETLRNWEKHGIRQAGFWTTLIGKSSQEITYMLAWDSMAEREKRWGAFLADPEWVAVSAQLDAVDRGKLAKKSKPRVDIALQRPAYVDGRHGGLWCCRLTVPVVRGAKVSEQQSQCCCRADQPRSRGRSAAPQLARSFDRSSFDSRVVDHLIHGTIRSFF